MAENIDLSVVPELNTISPLAQVVIGKEKLTTDKHGYWFVVLDRTTLKVVENISQPSNTTPPNLGQHNTSEYILVMATVGVGLDKTPQGDLFKFIDINGGARELRRVEQVGRHFNCGRYGAFAYTMVGILGGLDLPGFELSLIGGGNTNTILRGPFLELTLIPTTVGGKTIYTPAQLNNG
jgi:hypothetical protein